MQHFEEPLGSMLKAMSHLNLAESALKEAGIRHFPGVNALALCTKARKRLHHAIEIEAKATGVNLKPGAVDWRLEP